jgi:ABC-type dipeptide transport system, periplasmic component
MKPILAARCVRRRIAAAAAALFLLVGLAACGSPGGGGSSEGLPKDLKVLVEATQPVFDQWQGGVATQGVMLLVNEPLVRYDGSGFQPNLATTFEQASPTRYVFTLRDGVTFSDGSPVTVDDVRFTFEQAMRDDHLSTTHVVMRSIATITTDGSSIALDLKAPQPLLLYTIARTGIVSKAFYEQHGEKVGTPAVGQLGSGPYVLDSFEPDKSMRVVKRPDYWGDPAPFESITFTIVPDDSARMLALQSGSANAIFEIPTGQINSIQALKDFRLSKIADATVFILQMDVTKPPFDEPAVRDAVRHAINRQAVVDAALAGHGQVARALSPQSNLELVASAEAVEQTLARIDELNTYDPDLARRLLASSSVPAGFTLKLPLDSTDADTSLVAQTIAQDLAEVGIDVELDPRGDDYIDVTLARRHDGLTLNKFSTNAPDPAMPLGYFVPAKSRINLTQQDNPAAQQAFDESNALPVGDPKRGERLLAAVEAYHRGGAALPLVNPDMTFGLKAPMTINGFTNYWWMQRWDRLVEVGG